MSHPDSYGLCKMLTLLLSHHRPHSCSGGGGGGGGVWTIVDRALLWLEKHKADTIFSSLLILLKLTLYSRPYLFFILVAVVVVISVVVVVVAVVVVAALWNYLLIFSHFWVINFLFVILSLSSSIITRQNHYYTKHYHP